MSFDRRGALFLIGIVAVLAVPPAWAENGPQNRDAGKNPAQLFASDCVICHKSAQGLAKAGGLFGLQSFLREHYTISKESAAMLAGYLEAVGGSRAPARPRATRPPKGDERAKAGDGKVSKKPEEAKPTDAKPADAKPSDNKPSDNKPAESKPAESKPEKSD